MAVTANPGPAWEVWEGCFRFQAGPIAEVDGKSIVEEGALGWGRSRTWSWPFSTDSSPASCTCRRPYPWPTAWTFSGWWSGTPSWSTAITMWRALPTSGFSLSLSKTPGSSASSAFSGRRTCPSTAPLPSATPGPTPSRGCSPWCLWWTRSKGPLRFPLFRLFHHLPSYIFVLYMRSGYNSLVSDHLTTEVFTLSKYRLKVLV